MSQASRSQPVLHPCRTRYAALFLLPLLAGLALFWVYPMVRSLILSFQATRGLSAQGFVGWDNYRYLLGDRLFWAALVNTALFAVLFLLVQIPAALALAMLLNHRRLRCRGAFRLVFFSTHFLGSVVVAALFGGMLGGRGSLMHHLQIWINPQARPVPFLTDPALTMVSLLLAAWWLSIGYGMVYLLAALQTIDRDLYDAAAMDGAGRWGRFWHVTLPGVWPVLSFLIVAGTLGAMQLFELPYVLFGGPGPGGRALTLVMVLYGAGFESGNLGYASALGWVLALLLGGLAWAQIRLLRWGRDS